MMGLREKRSESYKTQTEVANALGVTQGAVAQWETGETGPSIDKLPILAKLYGCTIDELFEGHRTDEKNHEDS